MATGRIVKTDRTWQNLVTSQITGNGTYPMAIPLDDFDTVCVSLIASGTIRQSVSFTKNSVIGNLAFPDFYWANYRCYCSVKFSGNNVVISDFTVGLAGVTFLLTAL